RSSFDGDQAGCYIAVWCRRSHWDYSSSFRLAMELRAEFTQESLCDKLDHLALQQLDLMDQLIRAKMTMEESIRPGYFLMGKTRYSLGQSSVSRLQLPGENSQVKPMVTTTASQHTTSKLEGGVLYQSVEANFHNPITTVEEEEEEAGEASSSSCYEEPETLLRKRGVKLHGEQGVEDIYAPENDEVNYSESSSSEAIKTINRDPIRWFSALPPQTLRQSQTFFKTAIQMSVKCANIQWRLNAIIKENKRLMEIKRHYERLEKEG
ncbi:unnamed protein product, partial [Meganyctiphanes norvegica]